MHNRHMLPLLALLAIAVLTGCGSKGGLNLFPVSGTVKFDGKPLEEGRMLFRAVDGDQRGFGGEIRNGKYQLEATAGKMTVEVTAMRIIPGRFDTFSNPGSKVPMREMYIPPRYNARTELKAEVQPRKNTVDFDLAR